MIRIDHITDPLRFVLAMTLSGAMDTPPSGLLGLFFLLPAVAQQLRDGEPMREAPRQIPRGRPARPHPSTA